MRSEKPYESALVIVLAETRAHEHTFDLFKQNVLDNFQADLCLCVADNEREDVNNRFYRHAKYVWRYPEPDDWGNAFDDAQRQSGFDIEWRGLLHVGNQWLGGVRGEAQHPGSAGILLFFRWFLKHRLLTTGTISHYDRFIVTRSDFIHRIPHAPLELLDPKYIWIPFGEDWGGYTDRHIITNQKDILSVLSITDPILSEPGNLAAAMKHFNEWNLERFIKFSFDRQGLTERVRRYPYTMYSIRSVDGNTRWQRGRFNEQLGYYIKYPGEYERFRWARLLISEKSDWSARKLIFLNALFYLRDRVHIIRNPIYLLRRLTRLVASVLSAAIKQLFLYR
jgi:hypothetical protein